MRLARQVRLAEVPPRWPPVAVERRPARAQVPQRAPAHQPLLVEAQVPPLDWQGRQTQGRCRTPQPAEAMLERQLVQVHLRAPEPELVQERGLEPAPQERELPLEPPREQALLVPAQLLALAAQQQPAQKRVLAQLSLLELKQQQRTQRHSQ